MRSRRVSYEIDCTAERLRSLSVTEHSEPMAGGTSVNSWARESDWLYVAPRLPVQANGGELSRHVEAVPNQLAQREDVPVIERDRGALHDERSTGRPRRGSSRGFAVLAGYVATMQRQTRRLRFLTSENRQASPSFLRDRLFRIEPRGVETFPVERKFAGGMRGQHRQLAQLPPAKLVRWEVLTVLELLERGPAETR